jgi:biotin carboxyl carrier protein
VDILTKYTVVVEDKQYKIDITKAGDENHFAVKIDDRPLKVEIEKTTFDYETPLQIKINEKNYKVQINKTNKQAPFLMKVGDIPLKAEVRTQTPTSTIKMTEIQAPTRVTMKSPAGKTVIEGAITAPMAGKIISVKVKKGDVVKAGAVVCILEAMKMENEIIAPKAGTVQEISVSEGTPVNEGNVLIVLK